MKYLITLLCAWFLWICCGDYQEGQLFVLFISVVTITGLVLLDFYQFTMQIISKILYNKTERSKG